MKVTSDIKGLAFPAMKAMMLHEAEEHGLPILAQTDNRLEVQTEIGALGVEDLNDGALRFAVEAEKDADLHALRDAFVGHIIHFMPDLADQIRWSDTPTEGVRPPNFQFAEILATEDISNAFRRIKIRLEKPDAFSDKAIHFRFVLPDPRDPDPKWPVLAANGSVKWPDGSWELHRPVYTARTQKGDVIEVDIFKHQGGRTSDWATNVQPGETVAMIGPGGSGVLEQENVLLAGDETAFPAIGRITGALSDGAKARVFLLSHTGDEDYPMPESDRITVHWLSAETFLPTLLKALPALEDGYAWVAGEKTMLQSLRDSAEWAKIAKKSKMLATYWTRD